MSLRMAGSITIYRKGGKHGVSFSAGEVHPSTGEASVFPWTFNGI